MAVLCGDKANGFVEADEMIVFAIGHQSNLVKAMAEADFDAVFQEGTADTQATVVWMNGQGIQIVFSRVRFRLIITV